MASVTKVHSRRYHTFLPCSCCRKVAGLKASHTRLLQATTSPQSCHRAACEELQEQDTRVCRRRWRLCHCALCFIFQQKMILLLHNWFHYMIISRCSECKRSLLKHLYHTNFFMTRFCIPQRDISKNTVHLFLLSSNPSLQLNHA